MRSTWLLILTALVMSSVPAKAGNEMAALFNCTGETCVISDSPGGIPMYFENAAKEALEKGVQIRIEGRCSSSCVIFASLARKNVCLGQDARMGIHQGTILDLFDASDKKVDIEIENYEKLFSDPPLGYTYKTTFYTPDYGADINAWALHEGKMPASTEVYVMTTQEALQFWKPCS